MPPPKGRSFPFAPRHSADWLVSHVTYDQAVDMFFNQTATQQNLGHDPLVYSKVFRGVTYATIQEAQQVFTETMNAEYEAREQRDLADENRGCKASKILNDNIRNRIVPTEDGLESLTAYRKPFGEKCVSPLSLFTQSLNGETSSHIQASGSQSQLVNPTQSAAQQAYDFTGAEWNKSLQDDAKKYQWDVSEQQNVSLAILLIEEAEEYLEALQNDTHGVLGDKKDYYGLGSGLKDANDIAKDLGGYGATAKAVSINGTMHIVIENYKPRYLDSGIRWQQATPQMLKMGYALNTVSGNLSLIKSSIFVEIAFSGAINAVDYMMHDEKTLGEVVGQFSGDVAVGVVGGIIAQGVTLLARGVLVAFLGITAPASATMAAFAVLSFGIGIKLGELDDQHQYTKPMTDKIEALFNEK